MVLHFVICVPLLLGGCGRMCGGALVLQFGIHFLILHFIFSLIVVMKTKTTQRKKKQKRHNNPEVYTERK